MGKIRVKSFGDQEEEEKAKKLSAKRAEKKEAKKAAVESTKDTETTVSEEIVSEVEKTQASETKDSATEKQEDKKKSSKKKFDKKAFRSKKYDQLLGNIDKTKIYSISEGLGLLEKLQRGGFDETVELHINTVSPGISGNVTLPNGTGKKTRVAVADDKIIAEVEKGSINFDILVATPDMMPKLAKVAKFLGPRGLMPNPKNGTITNDPASVAKKYEGGQINFKTEAKAPLLHLTVGKVSFGSSKLSANIETMINAVKKSNIVNVTLKSTMSPGIKIKV